MIDAQVLVFAKPPRIGVSKTRLAAGVGGAEARRIASFLLSRTLRTAHSGPWETRVYVSPDREVYSRLGGLASPGMTLCPQGGGDLTDRLERGLEEATPGPVIFIGTDAPDMTARDILLAIKALRTNDAVFGPATDGGFWLFGLNKTSRTRSPFKKVRWSGPHAMADVTANLHNAARIGHLATFRDIDDVTDWTLWGHERAFHRHSVRT